MCDLEGDSDEVGLRRKSARIFALEEKEKEKRKSSEAISNKIMGKRKSKCGGLTTKQSLKRSRKQKRLEDIDIPCPDQNQSQENGEDSNDGNRSSRADQQPNRLSSMPEKRILDFALAVLQRRDTYDIFAKPVNGDEVENYYTIIHEPMDFGTMTTKLQEGKYTTLEQFEGDVFLICSNAMQFNAPSTVYYKEARAMQVLARGIFSTMRTDCNKLESEFSLTRSPPTKKATRKSEIKNPRTRIRKSAGVKIGTSLLGPTDEDSAFPKREDPRFYMPWTSFRSEDEKLFSTVYNADKRLEINPNGLSGYKQSLIWFARGLGPTAKREIVKKLLKCLPQAPTPAQSTQKLPFPPSSVQQPCTQNVQFPITPLHTSPVSSNITFLNLNSKASSTRENSTGEVRNLMPPPKEPITQYSHNHVLGTMPRLDNSLAHNAASTQFELNRLMEKMPMLRYYITPNKTSQSRPNPPLGKIPVFDNKIAHVTTNPNLFGSSSRENRAYQSPSPAINLQGNTFLKQNFVRRQEPGTEIGQFRLASHLKVMPVEDPNEPNGTKFTTVDLLAEPEYKMGIQQATPRRLQSSGSSSQGVFAVSGYHGQYLTNSKYYANNSKQIGQFSEGYFKSDEFATRQMMNNKHTPLPSYCELPPVLEKADNGAYHQYGRINADHGPNLSLQL